MAITSAYGCGYKHPPNAALNIPPLFEYVGWKDFCEDVGTAYDTTYGVASEIAQVRGSWVSPIKLGMRADLVEGWDPSGSAPLIELSDSPDTEIDIMTNVNPETVLASAGSIAGRQGGIAQQKPMVRGRRPRHPPKEAQKVAKRKMGRDLYGEMLLDLITDPEMHPTMKRDKIIQMLDQGKSMNLEVYEDDECSTALMEAAASGNAEIVQMLLARMFKEFKPTLAKDKFVNAQDDLSQTAYSEAAMSGFKNICKILVDAGADPKKHLTPKVTAHTFIDINRKQ